MNKLVLCGVNQTVTIITYLCLGLTSAAWAIERSEGCDGAAFT